MLGPLAIATRTLIVVGLVVRAKKHKSLTNGALVVAGLTATVHSIHPWSMNLALLAAFYLSSTKFTKYKHEIKSQYTATSTSKGQEAGGEGPRNHVQVLANSIVATVLMILHLITNEDALMFGVIANYAAVTADTWSSELGILSKDQPTLITTLKPCPKGTNGGVSKLGLKVAGLGGAFIGLVAVIVSPMFYEYSVVEKSGVVLIVAFLGLYGSLLDSILGATMQKSVINKQGKIVEAPGGYRLASDEGVKVLSGKIDILSNNQVNLLMALITSVFGIVIYIALFNYLGK